LKAVTMGMVTAIALFWSNKPNPAIGATNSCWHSGAVKQYHARVAINYYYAILRCRTQETPGAPEDTRGNKEGHQKDRRAQRHHEDRRAQRGIRRDTKRTRGNNGGIGAGRKATGIQQEEHEGVKRGAAGGQEDGRATSNIRERDVHNETPA
jgi:hypothetical protein